MEYQAFTLSVTWNGKVAYVPLCRNEYRPTDTDITSARESWQWRYGSWPDSEPDEIAVMWHPVPPKR